LAGKERSTRTKYLEPLVNNACKGKEMNAEASSGWKKKRAPGSIAKNKTVDAKKKGGSLRHNYNAHREGGEPGVRS